MQVSTRHYADAAVATLTGRIDHQTAAQLEAALAPLLAEAGANRGALVLDFAAVAAGQCDASFDLGLNAWDVAAGGLPVSEAGGRVSNFRSEPDFVETRECIAGNPALQAGLAAILRPFASRRGSPNSHAN